MIVYYINLDHRKDRRTHITKVISEIGLDKYKVKRIRGHYLNDNGALGCALSHIEAIEDFLKSKEKTSIILEDDFMYYDKDNFIRRLNDFFDCNIEWNLLQLSSNTIQKESTKYNFLSKILESQTTSGYMLNHNFCNKLLDCFCECRDQLLNGPSHDWHIDQNWKKLQPQSLWYCFEPKLGYQIDGWSDIEKMNVTYRC